MARGWLGEHGHERRRHDLGRTPQGQAQFVRDLVAAVAATPGGHGVGACLWYPEAIQVPGLFVWGGGSLALFDATGNVLPAASVLGGR